MSERDDFFNQSNIGGDVLMFVIINFFSFVQNTAVMIDTKI